MRESIEEKNKANEDEFISSPRTGLTLPALTSPREKKEYVRNATLKMIHDPTEFKE